MFIGLILGILASLPYIYFFVQHNPEVKQTVRSLALRGKLLAAQNERPQLKKQVVGFFPYWNLNKVNDVDLTNLTTIYYFAIDLNGDGSFNTSDPGIQKLHSSAAKLLKQKAEDNGTRWGVTIVNLDQNSIAKNINNPTHQTTIINNTIKLMKDNDFTDLNIDLEYVGSSDPTLQKDFTAFIQKFTTAVHNEIPSSTVTFDAFADSVKKPRIFDMQALGQILDSVVIMAYDFHRPSSQTAGPVAPLNGKERYNYDVQTAVTDYLTKVPPNKILLGVPFYGYEWPTENDQKGSFVIYSPHGPEISSYSRSIQTAQQNNATINFDDESKSVWFPYFDKDSRTWRQVWFENQRSLGLKFDLVNQSTLSGVAIFALGYDGKNADPLWDEIKLKFK